MSEKKAVECHSPTYEPTEQEDCIALEAHKLVFGQRQVDYGLPLDDFSRTAEFWTTWLHGKGYLLPGVFIEAEDVGPMMALVKLSRECNTHLRDNLTDVAGYMATYHRVVEERKRREMEQDL